MDYELWMEREFVLLTLGTLSTLGTLGTQSKLILNKK